MRIDREKIAALAALPDDKLWGEIVTMAAGLGFKLPTKTPPPSDMQRLRSAVTGQKINIGDAMRVLKTYKREE
jgi:hypothetical protein